MSKGWNPEDHPRDRLQRFRDKESSQKPDKLPMDSVPLPPPPPARTRWNPPLPPVQREDEHAFDSHFPPIGVEPDDTETIHAYNLLHSDRKFDKAILDRMADLDERDKTALLIARRYQRNQQLSDRDKAVAQKLALDPQPISSQRFAFLTNAGMQQELISRADTDASRARQILTRENDPTSFALRTVNRLGEHTQDGVWREYEKYAWHGSGRSARSLQTGIIANREWPHAQEYADQWVAQDEAHERDPESVPAPDVTVGNVLSQRPDVDDATRDRLRSKWEERGRQFPSFRFGRQVSSRGDSE